MALHFVATLLLLALTTASAPDEGFWPGASHSCDVEGCLGTFKYVKYSRQEVRPGEDLKGILCFQNGVALDHGATIILRVFGQKIMLHEEEEVPLDEPQEFNINEFHLIRHAVKLPIAPENDVEVSFEAKFGPFSFPYYMMRVEIRAADGKLVTDAKMTLSDESSRPISINCEDLTKPGGPGWLHNLKYYSGGGPDAQGMVFLQVGHKPELTTGSRWDFRLRQDGLSVMEADWNLEEDRIIRHKALSFAMRGIELPKEPGVMVTQFDACFRYPSKGYWTLDAELFDANGVLILHLLFSVGIYWE